MPGFLDIASTPSVKAAQRANGSAEFCARLRGKRAFDHFTDVEAQFIAERDSFYLATATESGWPYVQHRGGPPGFLHVLGKRTLGFGDYRGNRQYISLGNLTANDHVCLLLVDYANGRRLKIYAHAETRDLSRDRELALTLELPDYDAKPERAVLFRLEAFDWNCPQHITPRFSAPELERALMPMRLRLEQLEVENRALRARFMHAKKD